MNYTQNFIKLWESYPLKKGKAPAFKKWKSMKIEEDTELQQKILSSVQTFKSHDKKWKSGFIPHLSTFLNQQRWEDEVERDAKPEQSAWNTHMSNKLFVDFNESDRRVRREYLARDASSRAKTIGAEFFKTFWAAFHGDTPIPNDIKVKVYEAMVDFYLNNEYRTLPDIKLFEPYFKNKSAGMVQMRVLQSLAMSINHDTHESKKYIRTASSV